MGVKTLTKQEWNPTQYQSIGAFVPKLGEPLIALLAPTPEMRILDLGCGDGTLTQVLAVSGASVFGVDASPAMVQSAKEKGLTAQVLDAHHMAFSQEFDAVFSNAALHWMTEDPQKVLHNIASALKPKGVFVAEMGGEGNIAAIREAIQKALASYGLDIEQISPKFFPSVKRYQTMLEQSGFEVIQIETFPRPTPLPNGIRAWIETFATGILEALPQSEREAFLQAAETYAKPKLLTGDGWFADYIRLRFKAVKRS